MRVTIRPAISQGYRAAEHADAGGHPRLRADLGPWRSSLPRGDIWPRPPAAGLYMAIAKAGDFGPTQYVWAVDLTYVRQALGSGLDRTFVFADACKTGGVGGTTAPPLAQFLTGTNSGILGWTSPVGWGDSQFLSRELFELLSLHTHRCSGQVRGVVYGRVVPERLRPHRVTLALLGSAFREVRPPVTRPGLVAEPGVRLCQENASSSDPGGARTHDLLIKSQLLCQLSYRVAENVTYPVAVRETYPFNSGTTALRAPRAACTTASCSG